MSRHPALGREALLKLGRALLIQTGSPRLPSSVKFGGKSYLLDRHIRSSVEKELNGGSKIKATLEERQKSAKWLSEWWPTWRQFYPHRTSVEKAETRRHRSRLARSETV